MPLVKEHTAVDSSLAIPKLHKRIDCGLAETE